MKQKLLFIFFAALALNCQAQSFTDNTSGTGKSFTIPANVTSLTVAIWGGGGAGSVSGSSSAKGNGGGGGGATTRTFDVSEGSGISYSVGAGGIGVTSGVGGNGTNTTVSYTAASVTMIANGGAGANTSNIGGNGGSSSGGTTNPNGLTGAAGRTSSSGSGGNSGTVLSVLGTGGASLSSSGDGNIGNTPGAGGSGAYSSAFSSPRSGAGAAGRFFIRWITVGSISPATVCPGQTITITGTNFSTVAGTTVTVNGVSCTSVSVVNTTTITATVPETATDGVVLVTNTNGTNNGKSVSITSPVLAIVNTSQLLNISGASMVFHNNCTNLITTINATGASPITGNTTAKIWLEATQPTQYLKRHYEITPAANATTSTGRVTLYFTQQEFNDFNAISTVDLPTNSSDVTGKTNLLIEKRGGVSSDGSGLPNTYTGTIETINPADADIIWNATTNRWEISFDVTGFSGFFVKTQAAVLPLKWFAVNANVNSNKHALVTWKVQETNVAAYEIQKSTNAITFETIGNVVSKSDGENDYTFTETQALNGKAFYRIKQTDKDGRTTYSKIMLLNVNTNSVVTVYPNPTANIVTINLSNNALLNTKASITDISGKQIQTVNITQANTSINLAGYASGLYLLKLQNGEIIKLIKE